MTYRGSGKQSSSVVDAMELYEKRHEPYLRSERIKEQKAQREKLFRERAPRNPIKRFFYNVEKRRLDK